MNEFINFKTVPGLPTPLGANIINNGVQFSIFTRNATGVKLVLFNSSEPDSDFT